VRRSGDAPTKGFAMTRTARAALPVLAIGLAAAVVSGCGGPVGAGASAAADHGGDACDRVSAVLATGPNSVTDPVGYARAHVRPLRQIHTADARLRSVIGHLAGAYAAYAASNGSHAAKVAVAAAGQQLRQLCPRGNQQ
jgi:hypothetical protein